MNPTKKLDDVINLAAVLEMDSGKIEKLEKTLTVAKQEYELLRMYQQHIISELGDWAIQSGLAGPEDELPVDEPGDFIVVISNLIDRWKLLQCMEGGTSH